MVWSEKCQLFLEVETLDAFPDIQDYCHQANGRKCQESFLEEVSKLPNDENEL